VGNSSLRVFISHRGIISLFLLLFITCQSCNNKPTSPAVSLQPAVTVINQSEYAVSQNLDIINDGPGQPDKQNIWVALVRDLAPYQEVKTMAISPNDYTLVTDEYQNQYAEFDFSGQPAGTTKSIQISYRIVVNELTYDLSVCQGELPDDFTQPELHVESANPQIISLAYQLSQSKENVCQQVRSFYDYIGDKLTYTYNGNNWGAQATLGQMGADCTEFSALFVALSRSQKIPARYFEGLLYLDGQTDNYAQIEHVWTDVYLPGIGWVIVDPTLGRLPALREVYFAHNNPDHIIITLGANPSTLRGGNYWTHLYWPGNSTKIRVEAEKWKIELLDE